MDQMYKGIPFSPTATLTANISATDTIIPVSDVDAFPDAPNIATIGSIAGPNETIIYTGKTTTSLTGCTRGVEGAASDWMTDELIGRNFTAKDHADMVKNIEELENSKLDASYKVDVVNTADVTIAGKALDARQNNPDITGTLAQKVTSNTQQINDLIINLYKNIDLKTIGFEENVFFEYTLEPNANMWISLPENSCGLIHVSMKGKGTYVVTYSYMGINRWADSLKELNSFRYNCSNDEVYLQKNDYENTAILDVRNNTEMTLKIKISATRNMF